MRIHGDDHSRQPGKERSGRPGASALPGHDRELNDLLRLWDLIASIGTSGTTREKLERDRRTNVYTLTQRGQRELDIRREWENQYVSFE